MPKNSPASNDKKKRAKDKKPKWNKNKLPHKRVINLAASEEKPINPFIAIPATLLILAAAVAFGKFGVADRLAEASRAESQLAQANSQLEELGKKVKEYGDITAAYAHNTFSGMTTEEINRTDRLEAMDLLDRLVIPYVTVESWTLSGNQMEVPMKAATLQDVNKVVQSLQADDLVDYCTVTTANTTDETVVVSPAASSSPAFGDADAGEDVVTVVQSVTAQVTIYLNETPIIKDDQAQGDQSGSQSEESPAPTGGASAEGSAAPTAGAAAEGATASTEGAAAPAEGSAAPAAGAQAQTEGGQVQ